MPIFQPNVSTLKQRRDTAGLIKLLKSKDAQTRRAAIQALGEIGAKSSTVALCKLLLSPGTYRVEQADLANALGALGDPGAVVPLLQAMVISKSREQAQLADAKSGEDPMHGGDLPIPIEWSAGCYAGKGWAVA